MSGVALHMMIALDFRNPCHNLIPPPPSHCNQYFNHNRYSHVDLPMLHEISYFHTKLPVSRLAPRRRWRINSEGNFTGWRWCGAPEPQFALRRRRAPPFELHCAPSIAGDESCMKLHSYRTRLGWSCNMMAWLREVRRRRRRRHVVVCCDLEGGLNSFLWPFPLEYNEINIMLCHLLWLNFTRHQGSPPPGI